MVPLPAHALVVLVVLGGGKLERVGVWVGTGLTVEVLRHVADPGHSAEDVVCAEAFHYMRRWSILW